MPHNTAAPNACGDVAGAIYIRHEIAIPRVRTTMQMKFVSLAIATALAFAAPAFAHHSFSMFDNTKVVKLDGTVKELEWTNPHSWLRVMVEDPESHQAKQWSIELASTGQQARIGWSPTVVKPGDKVAVEINPLRDGTRGGTLLSIVLPDGTKLGHGGQRGDPRGNN
jgi:Family of unknown function (DUF6152)